MESEIQKLDTSSSIDKKLLQEAQRINKFLPKTLNPKTTGKETFFDFYSGIEIVLDGRSLNENIRNVKIYLCAFEGDIKEDNLALYDSDLLEKIYPDDYCENKLTNWKIFLDAMADDGWSEICLNGKNKRWLYIKKCLIKDKFVLILKYNKYAPINATTTKSQFSPKKDFPFDDKDLIKFD